MLSLGDLLKNQCKQPEIFRLLTEIIPEAIKKIRAAINDQSGEYAGTQNLSGEQQLKLDVKSNEILREACRNSGLVHSFASEEEDEQVVVNPTGALTVCTDPLDGSSLANVNFAVGTIIGIYPAGNLIGRTGRAQIAAVIAIYGPRTTLVLSVGQATHGLKLESDGLFYCERRKIVVAEQADYFAPGNLRAAAEREDYRALVNHWIQKKLTLRYSGGMVPDINHIFMKGSGIFAYPGFSEAPKGKLRLLFECAPMAFLMEHAGGAASDGERAILDIQIDSLASRTPILIGSRATVEESCRILRQI